MLRQLDDTSGKNGNLQFCGTGVVLVGAVFCYYGLLFSLIQALLLGIPLSNLILPFLTHECITLTAFGAMIRQRRYPFSMQCNNIPVPKIDAKCTKSSKVRSAIRC